MPFRLLEIVSDQDGLSERFDRFEVTLERSLTSVEAHALADAILEALAQIPARDRFALTVEISSDALMIGELAQRGEVNGHIEKFHEDGEVIEFRIEILKETAEQRLSVYSPTALGTYLEDTPLTDTLFALSKRFQNRLVFECHSGTLGRGSATLSFIRAGEAIPDMPEPLAWRHRALTLLQDNAFRASNVGTLVPQDFTVIQAIGVATLDKFMARAGAVLSAMFLSNFSDLSADRLSYRVSGYKLLAGNVDDLSTLVDEQSTFLRIADWAYGAEGNSDKVGLARNVITLCVQKLEEVPQHPEIWDAIQSNYQIYLKENIATYLEVRNKLAELLAESTHKTHSLVEGLLDSIRNGVLVILTFLLTVVVINGLKDTGVQVIFSTEYVAIAGALLVLSSLAIWASCRDACSRFEQSARGTTDLLRRMYAHVMIATELEVQVEPTIRDNRAYMHQQAKKYQIFWLVFAVLVAASFWVGHQVFGKTIAPTERPSMHGGKDAQRGEHSAGIGPRPSATAAQPPRPAADSTKNATSDTRTTSNKRQLKMPQQSTVPPTRHAPAHASSPSVQQ